MDRAAALSGARFAYLKGDLVMLELALVRWALEKLRGARLRTGDPAGARCASRRSSAPASCPTPSSRSTACPRTTCTSSAPREVALASLHAGEILDGGAAAAALRRLLALLPARGRCGRQGHARHLPRAPVRQGRDVQLRRAGRVSGRARAHPRDRGGDPDGAGAALPRRQHRRRRPRQLGGEEVRLRGVAAEPGPLPRADLVLEHHRLPGATPGHPLSRTREAHRGAAHAQRHRGGRRAHDHRAAGERAAGRRQRAAAPAACGPTARPPRWPRPQPRAERQEPGPREPRAAGQLRRRRVTPAAAQVRGNLGGASAKPSPKNVATEDCPAAVCDRPRLRPGRGGSGRSARASPRARLPRPACRRLRRACAGHSRSRPPPRSAGACGSR